MKIDWRVSAITAGSAFLLSTLVGVIGNVSFGALILRAVAAAAVFGAGAIGARMLIDRFLPELRSASAEAGEPSLAGSVDIVVEGDDGLPAPAGEVPLGGDWSGELASEDDEAGEVIADAGVGVLEEVDQNGPTEDLTSGVYDAEEVEEIESIDGLPTVQTMAGGFTEVPLGADGMSDSAVPGEDPELMARAIRTVLKREE